MRIGAHVGPFYASQRVGLPRRRYRRGGSGNWLGWLVILAGVGWLISFVTHSRTAVSPPRSRHRPRRS
jgi:hypothetical protein